MALNIDNSDSDVVMVDEDEEPPPLSARELDQLQYHITLQEIGEKLQLAINAAYPNENQMRYSSVYVLLLHWEDEDPELPVSIEVKDLGDIFDGIYGFDVEVWKIPSEGSHKKLNQKVLDFVEIGGDSKEGLKIVYYGGHGMLARNRQSCWASRSDPRDPNYCIVKWSGIQNCLEEANSDVLLLLDCCSSGTANTDVGNGVTELIAACGFNASANAVGANSFTRALITELGLLRNMPSFSVGWLYNKILSRVQGWMPAGREMQKPPLHVVLTQNRKLLRSIQLSTIRKPTAQVPSSSNIQLGSSGPNLSSNSSNQSSVSSGNPQNDSNTSSASSLSPFTTIVPRMALTIRLKEDLPLSDFSVDLFSDWIKMMPVLAEKIKIEAGFGSFSTLLVVSMPVELWCYVESHPAISVMGLVTSGNLVPGKASASQPLLQLPSEEDVALRIGEELSRDPLKMGKGDTEERRVRREARRRRKEMEREREMQTREVLGNSMTILPSQFEILRLWIQVGVLFLLLRILMRY